MLFTRHIIEEVPLFLLLSHVLHFTTLDADFFLLLPLTLEMILSTVSTDILFALKSHRTMSCAYIVLPFPLSMCRIEKQTYDTFSRLLE